MRGWIGTSLLLLLLSNCLPAKLRAAQPALPDSPLETRLLRAGAPDARPADILSGALDSYFEPLPDNRTSGPGVFWLKVALPVTGAPPPADNLRVIIVRAARATRTELFAAGQPLAFAMSLAAYRGIEDRVFALPAGRYDGQSIYVRIETDGAESHGVSLRGSTLSAALSSGAEHARMIALAVGGLTAMALAALLIWFVMSDQVFILYPTFFFLQALYIAFLSGEGFNWPLLSYARPLGSFAWNVPIGLSGAVGCLFAREIANLKDFSPRTYRIFGWFAAAFVAVTVANLAKLFGYRLLVNALGNLVFFAASVFTIIVAYWSWRRGNRAAGWFLIAWGLLEGFGIAVSVRLLFEKSGESDVLYYYGLPLSMVAAAVLIALGVADRLRRQRAALTDAERRAQTDPLTGVLNRRSLIERLDAGCLRARARGLPIAVLFIDLDHFKLINDSFGHQAGDACLRAIVAPIHSELRQSDFIGRYGGEEFVVVLYGADAAAASPIAERILRRVADVRVEGFGAPIGLSCSIGVAASDLHAVWGEQLVNRADAAVYAAKRAGRNQVQLADPPAA